jgi:hypothetical protein
MTPELLTLEIVTHQAERAEVTHHPLAIRRNSAGRWTAFLPVIKFEFLRLYTATPFQFAVLAPVAPGLEFVLGERGQEHVVAADARGGR